MLSRTKFEISNLVNEILDQLPSDVWTSTTTTFMDPAIGGGQFVREIEKRLRDAGHDSKNIASRVFGFEEFPHRIHYAINKDKKNKLVGQYEACDFLKKEFKMKFDVVVGNPPYQSNNGSGTLSGSGPSSLWGKFVFTALESLKDSGFMSFVTPDGIFSSSNDKFSAFKGTKIKFNVLSINDVTSSFSVGQSIVSWTLQKSPYLGNTTLNGQSVDLAILPVIPKDHVNIYLKIVNSTEPKLNFSTAGQINPKNVSDSVSISTPHMLNSNGKLRFSNETSSIHHQPKVMIGQLSKWQPIFSSNMSATPSTMRMLVLDQCEGENLVKLLNLKIYKFADSLLRVSGRITWSINTLPKVDLTRSWTDAELYQHFNLTQEEIDYIEKTVK
jgi:site-specific DNA-methyltransferase (adenine-specific)